MSRLVFLSYATGAFSSARDALCESALRVGFDEAIACGEQDLDREFVRKNAAILSEKRGGGYWIWKPQIILQTLAKLSPGDILVYSDAGRSPYYQFRKRPDLLIAKARAQGLLTGVAIAQHGPLSKWTKRDAFKRLRLDRPEIHASAVVQATWSFWTPTQAAFSFLEAWREVCEDAACITDQPNVEGAENLPDFQDHRHDQSLSSLLTHARNAPYLDYSKTPLFKILALRPQSQIAHHFLKRIEDAEAMERGEMIQGLVRGFLSLKGGKV